MSFLIAGAIIIIIIITCVIGAGSDGNDCDEDFFNIKLNDSNVKSESW